VLHQSTECVLLGYPANHKGYRCLDLTTNQIITSQHVVFDEHSFPYSTRFAPGTTTYRFLDDNAIDTPMWPSMPPRSYLPVACCIHNSSIRGTSPTFTMCGNTTCTTTSFYTELIVAHSYDNQQHYQQVVPKSIRTASTIDNAHTMQTRSESDLHTPKHVLDLQTITRPLVSPIPKMYRGALKDPNWNAAMLEEFHTLASNNTWTLVSRPEKANIVMGKWIYMHKYNSDGGLSHYKARWVLQGFSR
jgi:hypothetical protein